MQTTHLIPLFPLQSTTTLSLLIKTIFLLSAAICPESKLQHQEKWHRIRKRDGLTGSLSEKTPETTAVKASTCVISLCKWQVVSMRDFGSRCMFMCSGRIHTLTN